MVTLSLICTIMTFMEQKLELKELTREVCEVAKRAGDYIRGEREKFSLERVERKHPHVHKRNDPAGSAGSDLVFS